METFIIVMLYGIAWGSYYYFGFARRRRAISKDPNLFSERLISFYRNLSTWKQILYSFVLAILVPTILIGSLEIGSLFSKRKVIKQENTQVTESKAFAFGHPDVITIMVPTDVSEGCEKLKLPCWTFDVPREGDRNTFQRPIVTQIHWSPLKEKYLTNHGDMLTAYGTVQVTREGDSYKGSYDVEIMDKRIKNKFEAKWCGEGS